jgi:hypothetical protein
MLSFLDFQKSHQVFSIPFETSTPFVVASISLAAHYYTTFPKQSINCGKRFRSEFKDAKSTRIRFKFHTISLIKREMHFGHCSTISAIVAQMYPAISPVCILERIKKKLMLATCRFRTALRRCHCKSVTAIWISTQLRPCCAVWAFKSIFKWPWVRNRSAKNLFSWDFSFASIAV